MFAMRQRKTAKVMSLPCAMKQNAQRLFIVRFISGARVFFLDVRQTEVFDMSPIKSVRQRLYRTANIIEQCILDQSLRCRRKPKPSELHDLLMLYTVHVWSHGAACRGANDPNCIQILQDNGYA
jgi:hypothetical protein